MQLDNKQLHIYDLDNISIDALLEYDICIIGSGPAGLVVCAELVNQGLNVAVLESGGLHTECYAENLSSVLSTGIHIKKYSRVRIFGGTSTTWSGLSAPLDPIDFIPRATMPFSGWPIDRNELVPYWKIASEKYGFPSFNFFYNDKFFNVKQQNQVSLVWKNLTEKIFLANEKPFNFGKGLEHIFKNEGVDLYYGATATKLCSEINSKKIKSVQIISRSGKKYSLQAKLFVLAANGIENARLLLASKDLNPSGLGNENDQVGRYLMNHPKGYHGIINLKQSLGGMPYYFGCLYKKTAAYAGLRLHEDVQKKLGVWNSYVRFEPLFPWSDNEGVTACITLIKHARWLLSMTLKLFQGNMIQLRDYAETGDDSDLQNSSKSLVDWVYLVYKVIVNIHMVAWYLYVRLRKNVRVSVTRIRLRNFMEMAPVEQNRVTLSSALDANGEPIADVFHETSEHDQNSIIKLHEILAAELEENNFGTLVSSLGSEDWPINQDASHHLGTTRMGTDPKRSVVDANLRLHHVSNVYVIGGSVFPTSGCANPTYTICALAIRLAKYLKYAL